MRRSKIRVKVSVYACAAPTAAPPQRACRKRHALMYTLVYRPSTLEDGNCPDFVYRGIVGNFSIITHVRRRSVYKENYFACVSSTNFCRRKILKPRLLLYFLFFFFLLSSLSGILGVGNERPPRVSPVNVTKGRSDSRLG